MHEYNLLKHKIMISLIRKPKGFSEIRVVFFNIPLANRINSCIRGKNNTQAIVRVCPRVAYAKC